MDPFCLEQYGSGFFVFELELLFALVSCRLCILPVDFVHWANSCNVMYNSKINEKTPLMWYNGTPITDVFAPEIGSTVRVGK